MEDQSTGISYVRANGNLVFMSGCHIASLSFVMISTRNCFCSFQIIQRWNAVMNIFSSNPKISETNFSREVSYVLWKGIETECFLNLDQNGKR